MSNTFGPTGLSLDTQQTLISNWVNAFQSIYGTDINLSPDSPDGQMMMIFIQAVLDLQDLLLQIYTSFDPDQAVGVQLDQRAAINGIQREGGTYTTTNVTVTANQQVTLYGLDQSTNPVYTVQDTSGNQWQLLTTSTIQSGATVLAFQAANPGAIGTTVNTITIPVTVIVGVTTVNNPSTYTTLGVNEESDYALRIRRQKSVSIASQGYFNGLLASLQNISGVGSGNAFLYENDTDTTDVTTGVPAHSIWAIIGGTPVAPTAQAWSSVTTYSIGQIVSSGTTVYVSIANNNLNNAVTKATYWAVYDPVAYAIYQKRSAGCGLYGGVTYVVTQADGSQFVVKYDTVAEQNLFIQFTATSISSSIGVPKIASLIEYIPVNWAPGVYQDLNINQLGTYVQAIDSNTLVTNPGLSNGETQILNLSGVPASGTFVLNYNGHASAAINWNDNLATITSKIQAVTGLSTVSVAGSLASQSITISSITSAQALIYASANSLATSAPAAITFSYNYGFTTKLLPDSQKYQFSISGSNIIITAMISSPASLSVAPLGTQTFMAFGGYGAQSGTNFNNTSVVWTFITNNSGGTIGASSGLYTAGSTGSVTDTIQATDLLGNTVNVTITVT